MDARIDFESIAARVDLPKLVEAEGIEVRRGKAFCPFHRNENTPALSIYHGKGRWKYRCHGCGAHGDAISWVAARENISTVEAVKRLGGLEDRPYRLTRSPEATPSTEPKELVAALNPLPIAAPEWQSVVDGVIRRAEDLLWSHDGADARGWLRSRGLADRTIRQFRLGYVAKGY